MPETLRGREQQCFWALWISRVFVGKQCSRKRPIAVCCVKALCHCWTNVTNSTYIQRSSSQHKHINTDMFLLEENLSSAIYSWLKSNGAVDHELVQRWKLLQKNGTFLPKPENMQICEWKYINMWTALTFYSMHSYLFTCDSKMLNWLPVVVLAVCCHDGVSVHTDHLAGRGGHRSSTEVLGRQVPAAGLRGRLLLGAVQRQVRLQHPQHRAGVTATIPGRSGLCTHHLRSHPLLRLLHCLLRRLL